MNFIKSYFTNFTNFTMTASSIIEVEIASTRPIRTSTPPKRYHSTEFDFRRAQDHDYRIQWINESLRCIDRPIVQEYKRIAKRAYYKAAELVAAHHGFISERQAQGIWSDIRKHRLSSYAQLRIIRRGSRRGGSTFVTKFFDLVTLDLFDHHVLCHLQHPFAHEMLTALGSSVATTTTTTPMTTDKPPTITSPFFSPVHSWLPSSEESNKHGQLKQQLTGIRGNYIGRVDQTLYKFGKTTDIDRRADEHARHFANFTLLAAYPCANPEEAEKRFRQHPRIMECRDRLGTQTEIVDLAHSSLKGIDLDTILYDIVTKVNQETLDQLHDIRKQSSVPVVVIPSPSQTNNNIPSQDKIMKRNHDHDDPFNDKMLDFLSGVSDDHKLQVLKFRLKHLKHCK